MEFGYSISSSHSSDAPVGALIERTVEGVEVARRSGFAYVQAGDHHAMADGQYLQNVPMLARFSGMCDHLAGMFVLPLWQPVLLAEQLGTLDGMVETLDVWFGIGWRDAEFRAFGVPKRERAARLEEGIAIIERLSKEDHVDYDGAYVQLEDVTINPKPDLGRIGLGGSVDRAIQRAGRLGDAWVASPSARSDENARKADTFRAHGGEDVIVRRDALVLEDGARARRIADRQLSGGYRGMSSDANLLIGDPDTVRADIEEYRAIGVDEIVVRPMTTAHATETLRACPTDV